MEKSKLVPLPEPIARPGNKPIKSVKLNEPSVIALQGLEMSSVIRGDVVQLITLLPRISELTEAQCKKLSFKNLAKLSLEVTSFLQS